MITNGWQPRDPDVARLKDRLTALAGRVDQIEAGLEHRDAASAAAAQSRKARTWVLIGGVLSGIVFPLALTAILTLIHLRGSLSRGGCSPP